MSAFCPLHCCDSILQVDELRSYVNYQIDGLRHSVEALTASLQTLCHSMVSRLCSFIHLWLRARVHTSFWILSQPLRLNLSQSQGLILRES